MIIIADSGSTKTKWCFVNDEQEQFFFDTEGYNPYFVNADYISTSLKKSMPAFVANEKVNAIFFYGAGCGSGMDHIIYDALERVFPKAKISIEIDLLAAARALLKTSSGFAAILGTGTNTCFYDGKQITKNIDSLGFILGDEGSGGTIGKKLLVDYLRQDMPAEVTALFWSKYQLKPEEIMHQIYTQPMANRYCSHFCEFIGQNITHPYLYKLVRSCFVDFFNNLVSKYPGYKNYQFNSIGSIAYHFKEILTEVSESFEMPIGKIILSPMKDLAEYHVQNDIKIYQRYEAQ